VKLFFYLGIVVSFANSPFSRSITISCLLLLIDLSRLECRLRGFYHDLFPVEDIQYESVAFKLMYGLLGDGGSG
jgi:hypothetical protein